jgi:hypothetical protein
MSIDLSTFWATYGVLSGDTTATNQYDFWRGIVMTGGTQINSQYDFFTFNNTTRYKFFNDLKTTYPEVWDETTFYQNTNDNRIFDFKTFYEYGAEYLTGGTPTPPVSGPIVATGGIETTINEGSIQYKVHTFLTGGTFDVTSLGTSSGTIEYLLVGGGGGGGSAHAGGAGAGGLLTGSTNVSVSGYTVFVGSGGTGGPGNPTFDLPKSSGTTGQNTTFVNLIAYGGGASGFFDGCPNATDPLCVLGGNGGSGAGGSGGNSNLSPDDAFGGTGVAGQGYSGGTRTLCPDNGAGGGGAGGVGSSTEIDATSGCTGGIGLQSSINGTSTYYAGGGGGGVWEAGTYARQYGGAGGLGGGGNGGNALVVGGSPGLPGLANTGGGGGGGANYNPGGGNGGSGVVIIRYPIGIAGITEANAYLSAVVGAGGTVDATMSAATQTFFTTLFSDNLWNKLYAFYPIIGGTAGAHKFNGKNPADTNGAFRLTFNGGITHSADGLQPNGSNGYAETHFNASTQIGDGNSVSLGLYINLEGVDSGVYNIGVIDGSDNSLVLAPKTSGSPYLIFDSGVPPDARTEYNPIDSISGITIGSCRSATEREVYKNGVSLATNTNNISTTYANATIPIGVRYSTVDGFQFYANNRFAFSFIGSGLSDTDVLNLSTAINTYQVGLGRYSY